MIFINNLPPLLCPVVTLTDDSAGSLEDFWTSVSQIGSFGSNQAHDVFQWVKRQFAMYREFGIGQVTVVVQMLADADDLFLDLDSHPDNLWKRSSIHKLLTFCQRSWHRLLFLCA